MCTMAMNASRAAAADDDDAPVFAEMGSETTDHFHTKVEAGNYTGAHTHFKVCLQRFTNHFGKKKLVFSVSFFFFSH